MKWCIKWVVRRAFRNPFKSSCTVFYLIAPRRPPGQDMLALGFVAERRRYKTQCKHTSEKQCQKIVKLIRKSIEKVTKSRTKSTQNGPKTKPRATRSQSSLPKTPWEASGDRFPGYDARGGRQVGAQNQIKTL